MSNFASLIKSIQDVMRQDTGVDGDAQRISQLTWLLFLKVFDALVRPAQHPWINHDACAAVYPCKRA